MMKCDENQSIMPAQLTAVIAMVRIASSLRDSCLRESAFDVPASNMNAARGHASYLHKVASMTAMEHKKSHKAESVVNQRYNAYPAKVTRKMRLGSSMGV